MPLSLPKLSPRRVRAVDEALKARTAGGGRPPSYGGAWGGGYHPGAGRSAYHPGRDYAADLGRIDWNGVVRLCLRWYGNAITQASFRVGRRVKRGPRKGEWTTSDSHDLNAILARPCPVLSYREAWTRVIASYLIDGNAYMVVVRDHGGRPAELWWVPNWQVEVRAGRDPRRPIESYRVACPPGGHVDYAPGEMLHIRDLIDDENPVVGMGVLRAFLEYLAALVHGGRYTDRALRRGNTGIVLMPPAAAGGGYSYGMGQAEEAEMLAHKRRLDRGLAGEGDVATIALTSFLEHTTIGLSPEQMSLDRILDRPEAYICAAMGLSALLLDLPSSRDTKTYANKAEARRAAWEDSLVPMLGVIAEAVQGQVLYQIDPETGEAAGQFGDAPGLEVWPDTSEVPALQENMAEKAEHWIALVDARLCTPQYAATQLDIPPEAVPPDEEPGPEAEDFAPDDEDGEGEGDDEDDEEDPPGPEADAIKAARGGGRRKKGAGTASQTPPNVRAAAARLKRGEATSADQKLLARWRKGRDARRRAEFGRRGRELYARGVARREKAVVRTRADAETTIEVRPVGTGEGRRFTVLRDPEGDWRVDDFSPSLGGGTYDFYRTRAAAEKAAEGLARDHIREDAAAAVLAKAMARVKVERRGKVYRVVAPGGVGEYRVAPHGAGHAVRDGNNPGPDWPGMPSRYRAVGLTREAAAAQAADLDGGRPGRHVVEAVGPGHSLRDRDGSVRHFEPAEDGSEYYLTRAHREIYHELDDAIFPNRRFEVPDWESFAPRHGYPVKALDAPAGPEPTPDAADAAAE